jgi:hypothetical protein
MQQLCLHVPSMVPAVLASYLDTVRQKEMCVLSGVGKTLHGMRYSRRWLARRLTRCYHVVAETSYTKLCAKSETMC